MDEPTNPLGLSVEALARTIESGGGAYMAFNKALNGLTDEQARIVIEGSPHSIAEVLSHLHYWQRWVLDKLGGESPPLPRHAAAGWPGVAEGEWDALVDAFLAGLEACKALVEQEGKLVEPFFWGSHELTVGEVMLSTAVHNGHHLGQITLLRQMIAAWPPEGGAYTW